MANKVNIALQNFHLFVLIGDDANLGFGVGAFRGVTSWGAAPFVIRNEFAKIALSAIAVTV